MEELIEASPLLDKERVLMSYILAGSSYKVMSDDFHLSESRIYKWKRAVIEKLFLYEMSLKR